jgi:F0F1-type ATP synthase epsilon subunit
LIETDKNIIQVMTSSRIVIDKMFKTRLWYVTREGLAEQTSREVPRISAASAEKGEYVSRESFREAIYKVVEYMTKHELSGQAKKLLVHYFNNSKAPTARDRVMEAIENYIQDTLPKGDDLPPRLGRLLEKLMSEADAWDRE